MNRIFYFYPHCYLKSTKNELLVYDTTNGKYIYLKNNPLSVHDRKTILQGFISDSDSCCHFIEQCKNKTFGYYIDIAKVFPFMYSRQLDFITSLEKERKALGYNLQSYTNSLLREVTILLNNSLDILSVEMFLQLEYPQYNNDNVDLDYILQQLSYFPYLESITLAGESDKKTLCKFLEYTNKRKIQIIHRVLFDVFNITTSLELMDKYSNYYLEVFVDNSTEATKLKLLNNNHIWVKAIVSKTNDLEKLHRIDSIVYLPILSTNQDNTKLLHQMLLSEDEILLTRKTIYECQLADYINPSIYGHLTIDYDGSVSCLGHRIKSVYEQDLAFIVNQWIKDDNCMWYYTRRKKETCKECALQSLCPPISIYEELGLFKCPCKYK